jgi:V8-like Glu-specific endopeptidase
MENNLLLTNHHVLPSKSIAQSARVEFNYQKTLQGTDAHAESYQLAPEDGFDTSPEIKDGRNDWTAVRVIGNPNEKWGELPLTHAEPKVEDEVIIVQHPGGGQKQVALSHNVITFVNDSRIQYLTDTLEGASGSPVFNTEWQVVAIHHAGGWMREPNSARQVYRNQGVHINVVVNALKERGLL